MSETKELKGYKESIEKLKAAGFPTFASIILMKQENEKLKTDQKEILEDNDYWQEQFTEADKERAQLQKENEELKATISKTEIVTEKNSEVEKLKKELKNYAKVINQLMGTPLTDTEEVGRLIEIAQYRNWSEL